MNDIFHTSPQQLGTRHCGLAVEQQWTEDSRTQRKRKKHDLAMMMMMEKEANKRGAASRAVSPAHTAESQSPANR